MKPTPEVNPMTEITLDETFDALSSEKRRLLLIELERMNEDRRPSTDALKEPEMVHNHLPRLEDYGLIEWHRDGPGVGAISKGPNFDEVRPMLEMLGDGGEPSPVPV